MAIAAPDQALYDRLRGRPIIPLAFTGQSTNKLLIARPCLLVGWSLREASGVAGSTEIYTKISSAAPAAANNVAIAAGPAASLAWVTGFEITGAGATAGSIIPVTLTGLQGGTVTYFVTIPAGPGVGITPLAVSFGYPGLPAAALAAPITLNVPSFGVGNTNAAASISGYLQNPGTAGGVRGSSVAAALELIDGQDVNGVPVAEIGLGVGGTATNGPNSEGQLLHVGVFARTLLGSLSGAVWAKF